MMIIVRHADMEQLDLSGLEQLRKNVDRAIERYKRGRSRKLLAQPKPLQRSSGYTLSELLGTSAKGKGKANPPKYRHPENHELTWTPRGRQPDWIKEGLQA